MNIKDSCYVTLLSDKAEYLRQKQSDISTTLTKPINFKKDIWEVELN